jgi:hypothetical protein
MTAIERDNSATVDLLSLVGVEVFEEDVALWTDEQVREAENWASALYLRASDNVLDVPPKPTWLDSAA